MFIAITENLCQQIPVYLDQENNIRLNPNDRDAYKVKWLTNVY